MNMFLSSTSDSPSIPKLVAHNSQSGPNDWSDFPNLRFVCSWFDAFPETANGVQPRFNGLDDCAHYVSECLEKEGIHCATPSAPQLVQTLRSRHDTKTLADLVDPLRAKLMIDGAVVSRVQSRSICKGAEIDFIGDTRASNLRGILPPKS